ncbi:MAG: YcxB family protein [Verrucomicrobiota bacterium]|jgi:hypothetical protein
MRITYKLTAADYIAAQNLHARGSLIGVVSRAICNFVIPISGLLLMLCIVPFWRVGVSYSLASKLLLPLIVTLTPLWLLIYRRVCWRYRFKASRVSNGPCVIDFGEDHIVTEVPGIAKSTIEWHAVKKYREGKKVLMIYVSRISFIAVPLRACEKEEYLELIALLKRKLSSRSASDGKGV